LTQNSALFLWLALSLQLVTKIRLSFGQVNRALEVTKSSYLLKFPFESKKT